jgi:hypothetical protein
VGEREFNMGRHFLPLLWLLGAALATADVSAQAPPQFGGPQPPEVRRPYRGVFAQPAVAKAGRSTLDLHLDVFGGYDDDLYGADSGSPSQTGNPIRGGYFTGASVQSQFDRPGEHVSIDVDAGARVSRYSDRTYLVHSDYVVSNLTLTPTTHWRMNVGGSFIYAPQYQLGLFTVPVGVVQADSDAGPSDAYNSTVSDYDLQRLASYRTNIYAAASRMIGSRSSIDGRYSIALSDYHVDVYDYRSQTGGARFVQRVSRYGSLRLGYFYEGSRYVNQPLLQAQPLHNIEAGVDYGRALSFSRRTRVAFSTGSAITQRRSEASVPARQLQNWTFNVIGSASLNHELGRTWTAQAGYFRSVDFHEGFLEPFLSNTATGSVAGLFSRRLRFRAGVDYAWGDVGVGASNPYHSRSAQSELQFGLSRVLAIFGRYVYYAYDFDNRVSTDPRFVQKLNRQGARVGLTAFIPVAR